MLWPLEPPVIIKPSPPTDAVEYDGEKAEEEAEEEKMLQAIAVAAISSGEGKKGLTLPEEGPSPSDAVQRPSSTDAAVEGSAPTDDEEKEGEKELPSQEESEMAVVDVAAVENISSAAEEADGKIMKNDTDAVDKDLDDKMSVEEPAIITTSSTSHHE